MSFLEVRPIHVSERDLWRDLMRRHHYLGFEKLVGERVLYVATLSDQWVALLAWAAAAWKCGPRDRWIGWSHIVRFKRLSSIANNIRFLILPDVQIKNLASRILSKNLKRLNFDWEKFHGHPIHLAETFVDPSRFEGTCYKAANWIPLGMTSGFGRCQGGYFIHGQPKKVFVYPLHRRVQKLLSDPYVETKKRKERHLMLDVHKLPIEGKGGLIDVLKTVADTRNRSGMRYSLLCILAISTCAMLSGARGYKAIHQWSLKLTPSQLKKLRCYRNRSPAESTIRRVLQGLDANLFDRTLNAWLLGVLKGKAIAVDGKTLRRSYDGEQKAFHLLSALLHEEKVVIAQKAVGEKTNEIPEVRNLLAPLDIEGSVVTVDALNTQVETATFIVREKKADFVMPVKDNQPLLKKEIEGLDYEAFSPVETTKAHGRLETRSIALAKTLPHKTGFPFISQSFLIQRVRVDLTTGKETKETVPHITSLFQKQASAQDLMRLVRGHWSIENSEHYVRDETFGEDRSRIRKGSGPQVMATLRNLVMKLIRRMGLINIAQALRDFGWEAKRQVFRVIGIV